MLGHGLKVKTFYYGISLLLMFLFLPAIRFTGDTNLPPLDPTSRLLINFIFLNICVAYIALISGFKQNEILSRKAWFLFASIGLVLCALPPFFSGDLYEYLMRGRIFAVYRVNPYAHASGEFPGDIFYPYSIWHHLPENYGPAWVLLQWIAPFVGGRSVHLAVVLHKIILSLFFAGTGVLFNKICKKTRAGNENWLTAVFVLNPNMWVHFLVDGHNDIVMIFYMLLAVYLALYNRSTFSAIAATAAVLVKFSSIALLPVLLIAIVRMNKGGLSQKILVLCKAVACMLLTAFILYTPFWIGPDTFKYFFVFKDWFYSNSIPYAVHLFLNAAGWQIGTTVVARFFRFFFVVNCLLALVWLVSRRQFEPRAIFRALTWMFAALYVSYAIPFNGHHLTWVLPFLILSEFPYTKTVVCLFSFSGIFAYFKRLSFLFILAFFLYVLAVMYKRWKPKNLSNH